MASDFATIQVNGRMTNDPRKFEVGETCKVVGSIAVNRYHKKKGQEDLIKKTTFLDFTAWGATGERVMKYGAKGAKVSLTGDFETDQYEKEGETIRRDHINVRNISIFTAPSDGPQTENKTRSTEEVPF